YYVIESPHEKGVIYTGSDCGLVHLTKDGGKSWQNVTPAGLPECMIHSIEVSPHEKGTVYISASRYKFNDYSNMAYKSTDYGKTWTKIGNGIETDDFIKVIREDKKVKDILYAGAERGFYVSFNGGTTWNKLQSNLPVVPVTDLIMHENDLVSSKAGRAFWILDDLSPIQQSKGELNGLVKIYAPKPTIRLTSFSPDWMVTPPGTGQNPMNGVILTYHLKEKADTSKVSLEILDMSGNVIRKYSNKKDESVKPFPGGAPPSPVIPAEAGMNRFGWDYKTEALPDVPGVYVYGDLGGHRVAPGRYKARIKFKNEMSETEFDLVADPNLVNVTAADWAAQQQVIQQAEDGLRDIHNSVNNMRKVKKQIEGYNDLLKNDPNSKELINSGKEIIKKLEKWEKELIEPRSKNFQDVINFQNNLNSEFLQLRSTADTHDPRVTQGVRDRLGDIQVDWSKQKNVMNEVINKDISNYNKTFKEKNLPALITELKETVISN
ncbi:MAG: WD40/YVTN/BNR-like repeat-containing protein, partial [Cytophagales bacterium]